jgi:phosphate starvation-inducible PhoH-like protein
MKKTNANPFDDEYFTQSRSKSKKLTPIYKPRSENQKYYVSYLTNTNVPIVFGIGPAGCGKTLFACVTAIEGLKRGIFQKIVLTRPIVPVEEEELGFLPGTLVKKMDPWTRPLMDIFLEYYPQHEIDFMIGSGVIEISPLAYMRGRTFKHCFIIADEMQNSSPNQMLMLTTRIGEGSKMVITGDLKQSDRSAADNGLLDIMNKIKAYKSGSTETVGIEMVEMNRGDIERSPIVTKILEIFNNKQNNSIVDNDLQIPKDTNRMEYGSVSNSTSNDISKGINTDAALIPLSHISKSYNTNENIGSFF